jgi:thioester reductase-like protein
VPVNIYRVGQISGDTQNGVWNVDEMASMIIYAGAGQLKKMPSVGEDVSWIPVNICSASLVDLALKSSFQTSVPAKERVYHLLNPHLIPYDHYLDLLRAAGLKFDTVSPKAFIDAILATTETTNPLVKLSSFLEQSFGENGLLQLSKYETKKTTERCEILQNCPRIGSNLIQLYLDYWKKCQRLE